MLPNIGFSELIVILALALLLFGAKKLPDLAKSLGKSLKIFKQSMKDDSKDKDKD